ncbi:MAG: PQQ-binding-like beta-propeller repeat protein [Deltaproteobacteria bacterium]|nr:PQQ-binding-like beta-propeller repeat protein [Deltaproteobacteria bacterium]
MRANIVLGAALTALALGGCPASDQSGRDIGDNDGGADVVDTSVGDTDTATAGDADAEGDADGGDGAGDAGDADGGADTGPREGELGWPCAQNAECLSRYCVEGYDGRVCSTTCDGDGSCPTGWTCRQDLAQFPDIVFACTPSFPHLCRPCEGDGDCRVGEDQTSRCLPTGPGGASGAFCGGSCAGAACPDGYVCAPTADLEGSVSLQCVPGEGAVCTCSASAIAEGAGTTCAAVNGLGRCEGRRFCSFDGLTDCDAPAPAEDLCDGVDDDCDGETDEAYVPQACERENAVGSCAGLTVCAGADGPRCDAPEPAVEVCADGVDNDCDGGTDDEGGLGCTDRYLDGDGDRFGQDGARCLCGPEGDWTATVGGDCDDTTGAVRPGAIEVCDGLDNDCNDATDEEGALGCTTFYRDGDGDGYGVPGAPRCLCGPDPASGYTSKSPTDCDDEVNAVHPGAAEVCNEVDDDCDGATDEQGAGDCTLFFADADADTWGDPTVYACLCGPDAGHPVSRSGDCDDHEEARNPGETEQCDMLDNDCDGQTDEIGAEGCTVWYRDSDGDDYGVLADSRCLCAAAAPYDAAVAGDCNDAATTIHPNAAESCNGKDDDCDLEIDEAGATGCSEYWQDTDLDSFGVEGESRCLCAPAPPYVARNDDDCDDGSPFINPNAHEVCNQKDDDCNGQTDEGVQATCTPFYYDADGDDWGLANDSRCLCGPDGLYRATNPGDCDDTVATTHPFAAELCDGGGVDDDCDGATDEEGATGCVTYYLDHDDDGVGQLAMQRCLCGAEGEYRATVGGDCDEDEPAVHPGAPETCNDRDDDCDGVVDPAGAVGCAVQLRDSDQDGYGVAGDTLCLCDPTAPFNTTTPGDCNDADPNVNPAGHEVCNGKDDDCSLVADDPGTEGCVGFHRDDDGDTWGITEDALCLCAPSGPYRATSGGDCDDAAVGVNPAVTEVCNGKDDDCEGGTDEEGAAGCTIFFRDHDGDLFGVAGDFKCLCAATGEYRAGQDGDCDDDDADAHPDAEELCDGKDDDCDGETDEEDALDCVEHYRDLDHDTYGAAANARCLCGAEGAWSVTRAGDCNDATDLISPAAPEYCNGVDDDCDTATDEADAIGCQSFYVDVDGDGWGTGAAQCLCSAQGTRRATKAGDCADDVAAQNPGKPELCSTVGVDDDCDGATDEANATGCTDYYLDADSDTYGVTLSRQCLCAASGSVKATRGGDCNDGSNVVHPARAEVCNGVDDDCDGLFDEGCGMQSGGWPTAKYDARRSGHGKGITGPRTNTLRWKRQIDATLDLETSATVDLAGNIIYVAGTKLYKLRASDGATIWQKTLPAAMSSAASPTLRTGGTIVVPVGNGVALYDSAGTLLWHKAFPAATADEVTGAPLVDAQGNVYVVGYAKATALDAGGNVMWTIAVPNLQYVPAHVAMSPTTGRIYFGCSNHTLFSVEQTGFVAWTYVVDGQDVDAASAISESGVIYQSFGSSAYRVVDNGTSGSGTSGNAGGDMDAHVAVWRDSQGKDHVMTNANGTSGLRSFNGATMALEWTFAMTKSQAKNSTPIMDDAGYTYVGDDARHFYCVKPDGTQQWVFGEAQGLSATEVDTQAALVPGGVIFGDDDGWIYFVADP